MAKSFPSAHIVALDLTAPNVPAPSNVTFIGADFDQPWQLGSFDFIHARMLNPGAQDWPSVLQKCWEHLEPGGWLELLDICFPLATAQAPQTDNPSPPYLHFTQVQEEAWGLIGRDFYSWMNHTQRLQDLGFQDVKEREFRWPVGAWGSTDHERRIGELYLEDAKMHSSATAKILSHHPDVSMEDARQLIDDALKDLAENSVRRQYYSKM